jgi:trk system potassium uptake protein TrkH
LNGDENLTDSLRYGFFQVISVITTTGFITQDYTAWTPLLTMLFFFLMFVGASAGSTSGGIKIIRHLILVKNSFLEFNRQIHPSAVLPLRLNGKGVNGEVTFQILAFVILYLTIFASGSLAMALLGVDLVTAMGAAATCLGNVGPGIGSVGPIANFAYMPTIGKWILALLMLLGRLELFTVLILFTPFFWRKT